MKERYVTHKARTVTSVLNYKTVIRTSNAKIELLHRNLVSKHNTN